MYRFAAAALLASFTAAQAQAQQIMPSSPQSLIEIAQQYGQAYMDSPDSEGRPLIGGAIDGISYGVLFYGCEGNIGCDSLQFFASFDAPDNSLEFVNAWNFDKRFASVYRRDDGALVLNYSVNIEFGVTRENAADTFDIWTILLAQFAERLYGPPGGGTK